MGLLDKIKNALFEEEEIEIPIKEDRKEIERQKIIEEERRRAELQAKDNARINAQKEESEIRIEKIEPVPEKKVQRLEKTFEFPVFDEEEFQDSKSRTNRNVLEYEKRAKVEKRLDFNKAESEPVEKKKFKPSPIISPVYGVIEGEFPRDEVLPKKKTEDFNRPKIDVDSVRNKAFGTLEDEIERTLVNDLDLSQTSTKTIDELLTSSADEEISVEGVLEEIISNTASINLDDIKKEALSYDEKHYNNFEEDFNIKSELEDILETVSKTDGVETFKVNEDLKSIEVLDQVSNSLNKSDDQKIDETLESDLFNLIDSMYESRKDE